MANQFDKMMLAINTEKLLNDIYNEIDKASAKGMDNIKLELQKASMELCLNVDIALSRNPNITSCDMEIVDEVVFLYITWEND